MSGMKLTGAGSAISPTEERVLSLSVDGILQR